MRTVPFGTSLALGGQRGVTDKVIKAFGLSEQMVFEEDEKATTANKCGMRVRSLKKMTTKMEPRHITVDSTNQLQVMTKRRIVCPNVTA